MQKKERTTQVVRRLHNIIPPSTLQTEGVIKEVVVWHEVLHLAEEGSIVSLSEQEQNKQIEMLRTVSP